MSVGLKYPVGAVAAAAAAAAAAPGFSLDVSETQRVCRIVIHHCEFTISFEFTTPVHPGVIEKLKPQRGRKPYFAAADSAYCGTLQSLMDSIYV